MITLIHPQIDPVIVSFGFISIRWYGLAYVLGFFIGYVLIKKYNKYLNEPLSDKTIENLFLWITLGVIIGGRLGYVVFYQTNLLLNNPLKIFYIWEGGMSFHGGLIGTITSIIIFSYFKKINFFILSDFISTVAPIGIFFGRIANFINIELYGRVTSFYFAMIFPNIDLQRRHPSQLYEALFEGLILLLILMITIKSNFKKNNFGINTSIFLFLYGIFRFLIEYIREPDAHIGLLFNSITMGQLLSFPMIILGIFIYTIKRQK